MVNRCFHFSGTSVHDVAVEGFDAFSSHECVTCIAHGLLLRQGPTMDCWAHTRSSLHRSFVCGCCLVELQIVLSAPHRVAVASHCD